MARRNYRRSLIQRFLLAALLLFVQGACNRADEPTVPKEKAELVVFAAASLREVFTTLGKEFERTHPHAMAMFNFAGSQELRTQIDHGASVDVFASADQKHMLALLDAKKVQSPTVFARNEPVMIVAKERAATLKAFADLPSAGRIVIGVPDVPIGRYTLQILDNASKRLGGDFRARVEARVVSRELNVRQVLSKVTLGEADAAVVYMTDAATVCNDVAIVRIPPELNVIAEYPIATLEGAPHPELARAWVGLVLSEKGRLVLAKAAFVVSPSALSP
jgi:molybdate transport system substrate-binding protein